MMLYAPKVIPVEIYPADWCYLCDDPDHKDMEVCPILTVRSNGDGTGRVEPCGCRYSHTVGEQGHYILRVTRLQKE
jgi:hypothetical protein